MKKIKDPQILHLKFAAVGAAQGYVYGIFCGREAAQEYVDKHLPDGFVKHVKIDKAQIVYQHFFVYGMLPYNSIMKELPRIALIEVYNTLEAAEEKRIEENLRWSSKGLIVHLGESLIAANCTYEQIIRRISK